MISSVRVCVWVGGGVISIRAIMIHGETLICSVGCSISSEGYCDKREGLS